MIKLTATKVFYFTSLFMILPDAGLLQAQDKKMRIEAYENLRYLCKQIGPRLSGSSNAQKAVEWGEKVLKSYKLDRVYLQPVMVPHWERGDVEQLEVVTGFDTFPLKARALGGSVGTGGSRFNGPIIEVTSFKQLEELGRDTIQGKIVFFNRPMNPNYKDSFKAYGEAVDQRSNGAWQAARYGAIAVLVRSMSLKKDGNAHTGALNYVDSLPRIPAMALSTADADWLSGTLKQGVDCRASMQLSAQWLPDAPSFNVVGEVKGSQPSAGIITIGGHLDSWDLGEGAHDDGAGIVHSLEVMRLLKANKIKPKHTIRCVLFMNEENGNRGGLKYAEWADSLQEKHVAAIESDRGGFNPEAFSVDASDDAFKSIQLLQSQLLDKGIQEIFKGYGGVDIGPLKKVSPQVVLIGLVPESTKYFDYHHAETDVLEAVDPVQLQKGAEAMYALLLLLDKNM